MTSRSINILRAGISYLMSFNFAVEAIVSLSGMGRGGKVVAILFAFLTGFLGIFGLNLMMTDVFLRDREKMRERLDEERLRRQHGRVKEAIVGRDLNVLAEEAMRATQEDKTLLDKLHELIEQSGTDIRAAPLLGLCVICAAVVGLAVGIPLGSIAIGVLCGGAASVLPLLYAMWLDFPKSGSERVSLGRSLR